MLWTLLRWAVLVGALFPLFYYLFAILCARRYFLEVRAATAKPSGFAPPVSILKPVRGLDPQAYENFASFCRQDYPDYELLFCAGDASDPAVPVIEQLIRDFPGRSIHLLIGAEEIGASDKVSKLCRMAREARYELLLIGDSDIRVAPDFLRRAVAPLQDPAVAATTCLYLGIVEPQLGAELEALGAVGDFYAGVLVSRCVEGVKFALGAAILTSRARIAEIGGLETLADCFLDDYELGKRIAARGYRIELAPCAVWTMYPAQSLSDFLAHQMRWLLAVRHARPGGHLGLLFAQGLPWVLAAALLASSGLVAAAYLGGYLLLRLAMAWTVGVWGLKDDLVRRRWWLLPLRDAIWFVVWLGSFFCNRIRWRGMMFEVREGRLVPLERRSPRG
jgi:ceramide glucosyltransferase